MPSWGEGAFTPGRFTWPPLPVWPLRLQWAPFEVQGRGGATSVQAWAFSVPMICPAGNHMTIRLKTPAGAVVTVTLDVATAREPLDADELQQWATLQCRLMASQLPATATGATVKGAFEARPLDLTVSAQT